MKMQQAVMALLLAGALLLAAAPIACADNLPTQEELFRSISSNVDQPTDGRKMLAVLAAIAAVMVMAAVISKRQKRAAMPQKLNHTGKLLKELMKTAGMTRGQVKLLKSKADEMASAGKPLQSPVTLLLCPSLTQAKKLGGQ